MPPITSTTRSTSSRATRPGGVGGQQLGGHVDLALRVRPAYGDADELDRDADPGGQVVGLLAQQPDHLAAHRAAARAGPASAACHHGLVHLITRCSSMSGSSGWPGRVDPAASAAWSAPASVREQIVLGLAAHDAPVARPSRTATTGGRSAWL